MRKLILTLALSLDGSCFRRVSGTGPCAPVFLIRNTSSKARDSRKTYEMMMGVEQPGFPGMKEYIFSTTVKTVAPGNYLVTGDIKTQVLRIKAEQGKDIWLFGGASLTTSLINLGLVDEIALAVHPVLLGGGKPLFSGIYQRQNLELLSCEQYNKGLVVLTYKFLET